MSGGSVAAISSSNANVTVVAFNVVVVSTTSDCVNNTGGQLSFYNSVFPNIGGPSGIITNGASATCELSSSSADGINYTNGARVQINNSQVKDVAITGASNFGANFTAFDVSASNLSIGGTSSVNLNQCLINGNTPSITIAAGASLSIDQSTINSSGAGFCHFWHGIFKLWNPGIAK